MDEECKAIIKDHDKNQNQFVFMQHFEDNYQIQNIDKNKIQIQTLNVCTLTKTKLLHIINFLNDKELFIQSITEINIFQEDFSRLKDCIPSNIKQFIEYQKFRSINGGILYLYSDKLKIRLKQDLAEQNDFRILFTELICNNVNVLIVPVYLPTVHHILWQNLDQLNPYITQEFLRNQNGYHPEYSHYHELFNNLLTDEINENYHIIIMGDFNTHVNQVNEQIQNRYIIQRDNLINNFSNNDISLKNFDPNNNFNFTQFKGDKFSCLDYFFVKNRTSNLLSEIKIFNDPDITTDHNCICSTLTLDDNVILNKPNINKTQKVMSNTLNKEDKLVEYQNELLTMDISEQNLSELILKLKEPLTKLVVEKKNKNQIDDDITKQLRRLKTMYLNERRGDLASVVTKELKKYVQEKTQERWKERVNTIVQNRRDNIREWWALITRYVKPKKTQVKLMRNQEGFQDVQFTLRAFSTQFQNLHYRQLQVQHLEPFEDWIALFVVKHQPPDAFAIFQDMIQPQADSQHLIDESAISQVFIALNQHFETNYSLSDVFNSFEDAKNRRDGQQFKPFTGLKVTREELKGYIKKLKRHKAPGSDQIDNLILKSLPDLVLERLAELFNDILDHQYMEPQLKNVIITLLSKTDRDNPDASDYRPISLLSCISFKLLEQVILRRLYLPVSQFSFGFKQTNSTVDMLWVFQHVVQKMKQRNATGLMCVEMGDFVKAFNHCNLQKLVIKLQTLEADSNVIALVIHLFISQMVQFKIGDHLSEQPIKFNQFALHQGGVGSPALFIAQLFELLDTLERRPSDLPIVTYNHSELRMNHVTFADDYNGLHFQENQTRQQVISTDLEQKHNWLVQKSNSLDLQFSDAKSKWLTNNVSKLANTINSWNNWEISNKAKLLGIRFQVNKELNFNYKDQYDQIYNKAIGVIQKLSIAYKRNRFLSSKEGANLYKAFIVPIFDQGNIISSFNSAQINSLDSLLFKNLKHILGMRYTGLTLNISICFNLFGQADRKQIYEIMFQLKHTIVNREQINACSNAIRNDIFINHEEKVDSLLSEINLTGLYEQLVSIAILDPQEQIDLSPFKTIQKFQRNLKLQVDQAVLARNIRKFLWRQMKVRKMACEAGQVGQGSLEELEAFIGARRAEMIGLDQEQAKFILQHHTFFQVFLYSDFNSKLNSQEVNTERRQNKRFLKIMMCNYRFNQRTKIVSTDPNNNSSPTTGVCLMCHDGSQEDERHFLVGCNQYDDLKALAFNELLQLCNFNLSQADFLGCLDQFLFASFETLSLQFEEGLNLVQQRKFNLVLKLMVNDMLDRRKFRMLTISENFIGRQDVIDRDVQIHFKQVYGWRQ